jgi:hypothetical protein
MDDVEQASGEGKRRADVEGSKASGRACASFESNHGRGILVRPRCLNPKPETLNPKLGGTEPKP